MLRLSSGMACLWVVWAMRNSVTELTFSYGTSFIVATLSGVGNGLLSSFLLCYGWLVLVRRLLQSPVLHSQVIPLACGAVAVYIERTLHEAALLNTVHLKPFIDSLIAFTLTFNVITTCELRHLTVPDY